MTSKGASVEMVSTERSHKMTKNINDGLAVVSKLA